MKLYKPTTIHRLLPLLLVLALAAGCSDDETPADSGSTPDQKAGQEAGPGDSGGPDRKVAPDAKPDGVVQKPDAAPDKAVVKPDMASDKAVVKPDMASDKAVVKPDMLLPDSAVVKPDAGNACAAKPSGFCKLSDPACSWSGQLCKCLSVCGGVKPPPGKEYIWTCKAPPPAACPPSAPKTGLICSPNGLKCAYGHCPVTRADCILGKWSVKTDPLPP